MATEHEASGPTAVLTHEHHEVDDALEGFLSDLESERSGHRVGPVLVALTALRRHIYIEEEVLFPPLAKAGLTMPIAVMFHEHGELWRSMDALEALLAGDDSAAAREQEAALCHSILEQLQSHNHKEELIVYATAEKTLTPDELASLTTALAGDELPDGWVCRDAEPAS